MALNSINTNIAAYFAQQNINQANNSVSSSVGRLSSGNRIVRASDDVAAMSVGTSLRATVSTLKMGLLNASQGSSMLQVADGALGKIQDMLLRQKALATQATSGSLTSAERGFLNQEFQNLTQEIDRLVTTTNFNGVNLLGGGLGTNSSLVRTDTLAGAFDPTSADNTGASFDASQHAIETFDRRDGTTLNALAGGIEFLRADGTTDAADTDFLMVNGAVYGQIGSFSISNVVYDVSASITVDINGVKFTGSYADGETDFVVSNGSTYMRFTMTTAIGLADDGTVQNGMAALRADYANTVILHTRTVAGVDFSGTRLGDVTGAGTTGAAMVRVADPTRLDISDFRYVSNGGADENILAVTVNGQTFTASGVTDEIDDGNIIVFEGANGQALQIDLTGLTTGDEVAINNIRTSLSDRNAFISALNTGFSRAGSGVDFALGTERTDSLRVQIRSASTNSLFNGQSLDISTLESAQLAGEALNSSIQLVTSIRADVGAMMSRFDFASANIEIAMQNQDAARGVLLDTDVAAESSAYATAQVQLQAGIAVLAQANQLPQNLLKLIG